MSSILHRMKSPEGRLSQQGYVLGFVVPFVAITGLTVAAFTGRFGPSSSLVMQGCALGWTFLMAFGDALNIRRYHDLGNSGRLYRLCRPSIVLLPLLAFALNFLIPAQMASMGDMGALAYMMGQEFGPSIGPVPMALLGITFVGVAGNVLYLSLMPGQTGPNAHGPDPRGLAASVPGATKDAGGKTFDSDDDPVKRALAAYEHERAGPPAQAARAAAPMGRAPVTPGSFGKKRR